MNNLLSCACANRLANPWHMIGVPETPEPWDMN